MTLYERIEQLSDTETSTSTRRRLLGRAAKASLGFALVITGLARAETAAAGVGCCVLAYQLECPTCTNTGYSCPTGCSYWAWYCRDSGGRVWICGECWAGGGCPGCSCGRVALSRSTHGMPRRNTGAPPPA